MKQDLDFLFLPEPPREESGTIFTEPRVVWNDANDLRVDLRGTRVDAYTLRIDRLNIFPQGGFDSQVTFSAISVPEPAGALAAAALGGLLLRRENRTR